MADDKEKKGTKKILIVVIIIVAVLFFFMILGIGIFGVFIAASGNEFKNRAQYKAALSEIHTFKLLLLDYYDIEGTLPDPDKGLTVLIEEGYLVIAPDKRNDNKILDPWRTPYEYSVTHEGKGFIITSYGSDKKAGGTGHARDIVESLGGD